jgi:hypothetical protein
VQSMPPDGVSPPGMSDHLPADQESVDPAIERLLSERARMHRAPSGLADRIVRATASSIAPPTYSMRSSAVPRVVAGRADVAVTRLRRFALAASLALLAGVAIVAVFSDRARRDMQADAIQVAGVPDPSAGLTDSEPVLVSLLAGSGVDPAGADEHPAEAILRMRDASFADMHGEVLLVVSAGIGAR